MRTRTGSQRSGTRSRGPNGSTRTATASQKSNDVQHRFQFHGSRPIGFSQRLTVRSSRLLDNASAMPDPVTNEFSDLGEGAARAWAVSWQKW